MADEDAALFDSLYAGEVVRPREETQEESGDGIDGASGSLIGRRLFFRGLPFELDKAGIRSLLSQHGEVERIETWKARRGICVVDFREARCASKCLVSLDGTSIGRNRITVNPERLFVDNGAAAESSEEEEEKINDDGMPPFEFSGRGSRADVERQRIIERKYKHRRVFCELCGTRRVHFAQGCFLADKTYHRKLINGEVEAPEEYARKLVEMRRAEQLEEKKRDEQDQQALARERMAEASAAAAAAVGRGRSLAVPSWMKNPELKAKALRTTPQREEPPRQDLIPTNETSRRDEEPSTSQFVAAPSGRRRRRRQKDEVPVLDPATEMKQLVSNSVVWPLEDDSLFIKYDYNTSRLSYCRAMPSGTHIEVDVTPRYDVSRAVDACRLDVATDAASAIENAKSLAVLNKSRLPDALIAQSRACQSIDDVRLGLLAIPEDLPPLPDTVTMYWSRDYLAYYYYDARTGSMTWDRPTQPSVSKPRARKPRLEDDSDDLVEQPPSRRPWRGADRDEAQQHRWNVPRDDGRTPAKPARSVFDEQQPRRRSDDPRDVDDRRPTDRDNHGRNGRGNSQQSQPSFRVDYRDQDGPWPNRSHGDIRWEQSRRTQPGHTDDRATRLRHTAYNDQAALSRYRHPWQEPTQSAARIKYDNRPRSSYPDIGSRPHREESRHVDGIGARDRQRRFG